MNESPTKMIKPLSPNNNASNGVGVVVGLSSRDGISSASPKAPAPLLPATGGSSPVAKRYHFQQHHHQQQPSAPRMPASHECRDENEPSFLRLSPVLVGSEGGRGEDFGAVPVNGNNVNDYSIAPDDDDDDGEGEFGVARRILDCGDNGDARTDAVVNDSFFPDVGEIEVCGPDGAEEDEENEDETVELEIEETEEERLQREIEESEALARQLMAEEAVASYAMSAEYLRENADQFSEEDLAALRAAMAEEDPEAGVEDRDEDSYDAEENSGVDSYDALLRLGERIGDVREERWALVARERINALLTLEFVPAMAEGKEENHTEAKCQVCQFRYDEGDVLRRLPCGHCFHRDCIDEWLGTKDTCALCRRSIVEED